MLGKLVVLVLSVVAAACSKSSSPDAAPRDRDARRGWVEVLAEQDPDNAGSVVRVSIDTLGARQIDDGSFLVWLETSHSKVRTENGRPFDRELLRFLFRCESPADGYYKRVSATLLYGERPPVYQEAVSLDVARSQSWTPAKTGTFDIIAFSRACALLLPRRRPPP